jgi:hypothetical protein
MARPSLSAFVLRQGISQRKSAFAENFEGVRCVCTCVCACVSVRVCVCARARVKRLWDRVGGAQPRERSYTTSTHTPTHSHSLTLTSQMAQCGRPRLTHTRALARAHIHSHSLTHTHTHIHSDSLTSQMAKCVVGLVRRLLEKIERVVSGKARGIVDAFFAALLHFHRVHVGDGVCAVL